MCRVSAGATRTQAIRSNLSYVTVSLSSARVADRPVPHTPHTSSPRSASPPRQAAAHTGTDGLAATSRPELPREARALPHPLPPPIPPPHAAAITYRRSVHPQRTDRSEERRVGKE